MRREAWILVGLVTACSAGNKPAPPPACDATCQDDTAVHALRDAMKLAFNLTLQGKPVGAQDATSPCPLGGTVHVFGQATSNADQGATNVTLSYAFAACAFAQKDTDPKQTYQITLTGTVTESGTIAVQPSATTALEFASDSISISGTVYDPTIDYRADACALRLGQNGNQLAGTICGRDVGLSL